MTPSPVDISSTASVSAHVAAAPTMADTLKELLSTCSPSDIVSSLHELKRQSVMDSESVKSTPVPTVSPADLATILAYLADGGGHQEYHYAALACRNAISGGDWPTLFRALLDLYKWSVKGMPHILKI